MKTVLRIAISSSVLLLLVGCASTQSTTYQQPALQQQIMEYRGHDARYMALIESEAEARGIQVVWVNPPRKHAPAVAAVE